MKRQFEPIKPRTDVTNQCHRCDLFYEDKDVVVLEEGVVCLNCLDTNSPQDMHKMLRAGFQQEGISEVRYIQYGMRIIAPY